MSLEFQDVVGPQLPDELWILIISFLSIRNIGNFRAVCKAFDCLVVAGSFQLRRLSSYNLRNFYFSAFGDGSIITAEKALLENACLVTGIKSFSNNSEKIISWITTLNLSSSMVDNIFLVVCRLCDLESVEWIMTNFDVSHLYAVSIQIAICIQSLDLVKFLIKRSNFRESDLIYHRIFKVTHDEFSNNTGFLCLDYPSYINNTLILSWLIENYHFTPYEIFYSGVIKNACEYGYISVIVWLSERQIFSGVGMEFIPYSTAMRINICLAIMNGHLEIVKLLVKEFNQPRDIDTITEYLASVRCTSRPNVYVVGSLYTRITTSWKQPQIFYNDVAKWLITYYNVTAKELTFMQVMQLCNNDNLDLFKFITQKLYTRNDILEQDWVNILLHHGKCKMVNTMQWLVETYNITKDESHLSLYNLIGTSFCANLFNISKSDVIVHIDTILLQYGYKDALFILNHFGLIDEKIIIRAANIDTPNYLFAEIINQANMQKSDFLTKCYQCFVQTGSNWYKINYLIQHFDITSNELDALKFDSTTIAIPGEFRY